jgi:hypothetical protein
MSLFDLIIQQYTLTDSEIEQRWNYGESADNETPEQRSNNK